MMPSLISGPSQPAPAASMPTAIGSGTFEPVVRHDPREDEADRDIEHGADASDPMMPIGMSRSGTLASCAAVETASNPI